MQLVHDFVVPTPIDTAWNVLTDLERITPCMPGAQLTEVQGETYRGTVKVKVGPILAQFAGESRVKTLDRENYHAVMEARGKEAGGKGLAAALITAQLKPEADRTAVHVVVDLTLSGRIAQFGRGAIGEVSTKLLGQFVRCLEETVLAEEGGAGPAADVTPAAPAAEVAATAEAAPTADVAPAADVAAKAEVAPVADAAPAGEPEPTPEPVLPPVAEPGPAPAADYVATGSGLAEPEPTIRKIDSPDARPVNLLASAGPSILKRLVPVLVVVALVVILIVVLTD